MFSCLFSPGKTDNLHKNFTNEYSGPIQQTYEVTLDGRHFHLLIPQIYLKWLKGIKEVGEIIMEIIPGTFQLKLQLGPLEDIP